MTQREDPYTTQGCGCPEVYLRVDERGALARFCIGEVPEWIPLCKYREEFTKEGGSWQPANTNDSGPDETPGGSGWAPEVSAR
jgi:hypothetical protein